MRRVWQTLSSFIWWSYGRGTIQYDIMVALILLFLLVPINYKDKPIERTPHPTRVGLIPDGDNDYIFEVDAAGVVGKDPGSVKTYLQRAVEPIALRMYQHEVEIARFEPVRDKNGRVVAYRVWLEK